ncbi:MAG: YigZ family protein [Lewinellaceae bacterium]|nr:YigZ family protein [Lewinellaceae bacterium]
MSDLPDSFHTLAAPGVGEFKDRGSKFIAYAFPVVSEEEALRCLEALRKEHFKARHHCFAWRLGLDGQRFRANDDGEPSGTAGRPILGQIDAAGLTDVVIIVVRYFGGTLLGASGLIQAYRESAAEALRLAPKVEKIVQDYFCLTVGYALLPDVLNAVKKCDADILQEEYGDTDARMEIGIRKHIAQDVLLKIKALLWKTSPEEARTLDWPEGVSVTLQDT